MQQLSAMHSIPFALAILFHFFFFAIFCFCLRHIILNCFWTVFHKDEELHEVTSELLDDGDEEIQAIKSKRAVVQADIDRSVKDLVALEELHAAGIAHSQPPILISAV